MSGSRFPAVYRWLVLSAGVWFACHAASAAEVREAAAGPELRLRGGAVTLDRSHTLARPVGPGRAGGAARHGLIQLDGPLTAARRVELRDAGLILHDYLPRYAYVVDLTRADADKLAALPYVMHVGSFRREWKLDPSLAQLARARGVGPQWLRSGPALPAKELHEQRSADRQALIDKGSARVTVVFFAGVDAVDAAGALGGVAGVDVDAVTASGARTYIDATARLEQLAQIAELPEVQFVEESPQGVLRNATTGPLLQSGMPPSAPIWDRGLHGEGQIVGLIDTMIDTAHCMFADDVPIGPDHRKIVAARSPASAHSHGTFVAGVLAADRGVEGEYDSGDGVAWAARISWTNYFTMFSSPSTFLGYLEDAHDDGARIHSNSWGDDSTTAYTLWSMQADQFSYENEDDLVLFAISNQATLRTPENAKNVLAVAASSQYPNHNNHCDGGIGPTADGRRKPEIYAPGCGVSSAQVFTLCGTWAIGAGTSYACPAIAAAATLSRQYYIEGFYPTGMRFESDGFAPSGALLKATILNASVDMTGIAGYPSDLEGWGRLELDRSLFFAGDARRSIVRDVRNAAGLTTGLSDTVDFVMMGEGEELRVTLVFTDPPAAINAVDPVINNLDLTVTDPSGNAYFGNVFAEGVSETGGAADAINNVEQVRIVSPGRGGYRVTISATEVNSPQPQGYALLISGEVLDLECASASSAWPDFEPVDGLGDADLDGDLDLYDLAGMQACFGPDGVAYPGPQCAVFDVDGDGDVDLCDYQGVVQLFGGPLIDP